MEELLNYLEEVYINPASEKDYYKAKDFLKGSKVKMENETKEILNEENYKIEILIKNNGISVRLLSEDFYIGTLFVISFDKETKLSTSVTKSWKEKFPRTPHMAGSKGTSDDIFKKGSAKIEGLCIATEKMDGSNISFTKEKFITRSGETYKAEWTAPLYIIHNLIKNKIPEGVKLNGEFLQLTKSVKYTNLPAPWVMFGAEKNGIVLSYEKSKQLAEEIGLPFVDEFSKVGTYEEVVAEAKSKIVTGTHEGFVVRTIEAFPIQEYHKYVYKFVDGEFKSNRFSSGENSFDENWMNKLK